MSGGSVRDRIKAAEQAQGIDSAQNVVNPLRRGKKLSLSTDQHIKEEVIRKGDYGWHKRVDIGQHERFVAPSHAPIIKLTAETPLVATPDQQLPGRVSVTQTFATRSGIGES